MLTVAFGIPFIICELITFITQRQESLAFMYYTNVGVKKLC